MLFAWMSGLRICYRGGIAQREAAHPSPPRYNESERIHGIVEPAKRQSGLRRPSSPGSGRAADRARRAGLLAGSQRRRQEHAPAADPRRDRARRRPGHPPARPAHRAPAPGCPPRPNRHGRRPGGRRTRRRRPSRDRIRSSRAGRRFLAWVWTRTHASKTSPPG